MDEPDNAQTFGGLLREWRVAAGLTQEQLSERSGLGTRTIRDLERGRVRRPHRESVRLLATALGLPIPDRDDLARSGHPLPLRPAPDVVRVPLATADEMSTRGIPAVPLPIRQLPADLPDFLGRDEQVRLLRDLLSRPGDGDRSGEVRIAAVTGAAGVGKTTLAVHIAHQVSAHFPDGQLFIALRGASSSPVASGDVLTRVLRDLGISSAVTIPTDEGEREAMYRSLLAGKRVLIMLDDASGFAQVRPLLPGSADCAVLITSRYALPGLDGCWRLDLGALNGYEAKAMLEQIVGPARVEADPQSTDRVVGVCAGLPLAVRIVGTRLSARPSWTMRTMADRLGDARRRLDELSVGDRAIRASFQVSYVTLPSRSEAGKADPAHAFRILGLPEGPDLSLAAASALLGLPIQHTEEALESLVDAHLLESPEPGRYRFHDLLRLYASERAAAEEAPAERSAAIIRILNWYMCTAHAAARVVGPSRRHVLLGSAELDCTPLDFSTYDDALNWLDLERLNLVAAVSVAADQDLHEIAWKLPIILWDLFNLRNYWADWITTHRIGVESARRLNDVLAENWVSNNLAAAYIRTGRNLEAADLLVRVLANERRLSHRRGQAVSLTNLGVVYGNLRQPEASMESYQQALEISREIGDKRGEGVALNGLGDNWKLRGQRDRSVLSYELALDAHRAAGDDFGEAGVLRDLSQAYFHFGQIGEAIKQSRCAVELNHRIGHRHAEATALGVLGRALAADGHRDEAHRCLLKAYRILESIHDPSAPEMLDHLRKLRRAWPM